MTTRLSDMKRRAHDEWLRHDRGLAEIQAWGEWFLSAHTQRLKDLHLPPEQHDRELADVTRIAAAITAKMRDDYLLARTPRS